MTNSPLPGSAQHDRSVPLGGWQEGPIRDLTVLLLQRLLEENGGMGHAQVTVGAGPDHPGAHDSSANGSGGWELSVPATDPAAPRQPGDSDGLVTVTSVLSGGRNISLTAGPSPDRDVLTAVAQRYLKPIRTVIDLGLRLQSQRLDAQAAVDAVQGVALLDLATGIVMARRSTDPESARHVLAAWTRRTGTSVSDLTTSTMLELLTGEEFQPS